MRNKIPQLILELYIDLTINYCDT